MEPPSNTMRQIKEHGKLERDTLKVILFLKYPSTLSLSLSRSPLKKRNLASSSISSSLYPVRVICSFPSHSSKIFLQVSFF
ncbi:hypothetical protein L6452_34119 [Arctium lappa]|uniref:Uncharacterized protein n=1 Tax=Arctium lappa TaxID=4217 RepID=A0ACB8YHF8_ARCLA|nr:hypothetical protein L6452_34119 [Arctium lappa]